MPRTLTPGYYSCELVGTSLEVREDGSGVLTMAFQVDTGTQEEFMTITDELEGPFEVGTEDEMFEESDQ